MAKTNAFFDPGGTGLDIVPSGENVLQFTSDDGFVIVTVELKEGGADIDIQTQEWDYDLKIFLNEF